MTESTMHVDSGLQIKFANKESVNKEGQLYMLNHVRSMTYNEKNGVQNFTTEEKWMPWNFLIVNIFCSISFLFLEHKHSQIFSSAPIFLLGTEVLYILFFWEIMEYPQM